MENYTIEQIDYLREKADISYEEAVALLEHYQGDLARCLIDLERRGRIRQGGAPRGKARSQQSGYSGQQANHQHQHTQPPYEGPNDGGQERPKAFVMDGKYLKGILFSHVRVIKDEKVVADLPVMYLILALCMAPHLMLVSVLLMFVMGYRIQWVNKNKQEQQEKAEKQHQQEQNLYDFVDKAADNIKRTASSFAQAVKQEFNQGTQAQDEAQEPTQPQQPVQDEEEEADPSEITIE